jgi:hypothetical protein
MDLLDKKKWAALYLIVNAPDIFSENTHTNKLDPAKEQN